jgi:fatty acid desaturase
MPNGEARVMAGENIRATETATWRLRLTDLPGEAQPEIRALHRIRPWANSVVLLFPALWICAAILMEKFPALPVRCAGILVIGICIQAMSIVMHEAMHGNLFRHPALDRWVGFAMAVPASLGATAYKVAHRNHHCHTRTAQDQNEFSNLCRSQKQYVALYYAWLVIGTPIFMFLVPWKALKLASRKDRRRIIVEYTLIFLVYAVAIWAMIDGHLKSILLYWLIPAAVAIALSNVRELSEHLGTLGNGDAVVRTRTVTSNRIVSFLMLNLNYHLEHHLFPQIPWYNLPRVHELLRPNYELQGADVRQSYLAYLIRSLRQGPESLI